MKCSLGISNFLEEISLVIPILLFSSISLHCSLGTAYLFLLFFGTARAWLACWGCWHQGPSSCPVLVSGHAATACLAPRCYVSHEPCMEALAPWQALSPHLWAGAGDRGRPGRGVQGWISLKIIINKYK